MPRGGANLPANQLLPQPEAVGELLGLPGERGGEGAVPGGRDARAGDARLCRRSPALALGTCPRREGRVSLTEEAVLMDFTAASNTFFGSLRLVVPLSTMLLS